jgi:hypothetical protein
MSTPREELHALIDSLPDSAAVDLAARHPAWFGAGEASRPDLTEHIDEILRDEFGRRPA